MPTEMFRSTSSAGSLLSDTQVLFPPGHRDIDFLSTSATQDMTDLLEIIEPRYSRYNLHNTNTDETFEVGNERTNPSDSVDSNYLSPQTAGHVPQPDSFADAEGSVVVEVERTVNNLLRLMEDQGPDEIDSNEVVINSGSGEDTMPGADAFFRNLVIFQERLETDVGIDADGSVSGNDEDNDDYRDNLERLSTPDNLETNDISTTTTITNMDVTLDQETVALEPVTSDHDIVNDRHQGISEHDRIELESISSYLSQFRSNGVNIDSVLNAGSRPFAENDVSIVDDNGTDDEDCEGAIEDVLEDRGRSLFSRNHLETWRLRYSQRRSAARSRRQLLDANEVIGLRFGQESSNPNLNSNGETVEPVSTSTIHSNFIGNSDASTEVLDFYRRVANDFISEYRSSDTAHALDIQPSGSLNIYTQSHSFNRDASDDQILPEEDVLDPLASDRVTFSTQMQETRSPLQDVAESGSVFRGREPLLGLSDEIVLLDIPDLGCDPSSPSYSLSHIFSIVPITQPDSSAISSHSLSTDSSDTVSESNQNSEIITAAMAARRLISAWNSDADMTLHERVERLGNELRNLRSISDTTRRNLDTAVGCKPKICGYAFGAGSVC